MGDNRSSTLLQRWGECTHCTDKAVFVVHSCYVQLLSFLVFTTFFVLFLSSQLCF